MARILSSAAQDVHVSAQAVACLRLECVPAKRKAIVTYFIFQANPFLLPTVMLVVLGLSIELPYRFAAAFSKVLPKSDAFNAVQAGLLTLAAFVLGLSFSQASGRFDARRSLVVKEANAIGTTWLRANQLEPARRKQFRLLLTDDAAARLEVYETPNDPVLYRLMIDRTNHDQHDLWAIASSSLRAHETKLGLSLLMQALNDKIDVSSEQREALTSHVPTVVVVLTLVLVTLSALSLGIRFGLDKSRPMFLSMIYVAAYLVVISMMIDYDRPNTGFVTVNLEPLELQLQSMRQAH